MRVSWILMPGYLALPTVMGRARRCSKREVDVDVQALRLEGGEAIGDAEELLAHVGQVIEPLLQAEVGQIVGADLVAQEGGELLVLLDEGVLPVGAKDVMAVLDLLEGGVELAVQLLGDAGAEDLGDLVGRQPPQPQFAAALEDLVDREVALEDEVAAVLDLADGVEAAQVHAARAPWSENFGPTASVQ